MGFEEISGKKFVFRQISSVEIDLINDFTCGSVELDKKLRQMKKFDEGTTLVFINETDNEIIGYCTYCASGLKMSSGNTFITHSAAEIKYFAISTDYQHKMYDKDFNISDVMFCHIIKHLVEISEKYINFDFILLYSVPEAVNFYKRNLFEPFTEYMNSDSYGYIDGCIPMFFSL